MTTDADVPFDPAAVLDQIDAATEHLLRTADLDAGYTPTQWPADFVHAMLGSVVASFGARADAPAMRLHATDTATTTGTWYGIGVARPAPVIHGSESSLLAWLMGRSQGADLTVQDGAALPDPPFLY